jgi:hypothetical protein
MAWRWYNPSRYPGDREAVIALHQRMELRVGRPIDLPELSEEPVIAAVVNEVDGQIKHCIFLEAEVEACAVGEEPLPAELVRQAIDEYLMPQVQAYKIRIVRAFVPAMLIAGKRADRLGAVPRLLQKLGFTREDSSMVQFFRWLAAPVAESRKENADGAHRGQREQTSKPAA